MHKPEIFTDRDGKPQPSMEITASFIQFSPFGKPGGSTPGEGQQAHGHAPAHQQASTQPSGFGSYPDAAGSPYAPPMGGPKGSTIDDEVPF